MNALRSIHKGKRGICGGTVAKILIKVAKKRSDDACFCHGSKESSTRDKRVLLQTNTNWGTVLHGRT